ncbi:hypothetical protein [Acidianus infernus]|nr:hypothetical protein [Acidianus infernus]
MASDYDVLIVGDRIPSVKMANILLREGSPSLDEFWEEVVEVG